MNTKPQIKLYDKCYWNAQFYTVTLDGETVKLTNNMTKFLALMIERIDRPVSSVDIFFHIWDDYNTEFNSKNVRNLISNLRKRLPFILINNSYGGRYILKKYRDNIPDITDYIIDILDQAKNGITICDPNQDDNPLIFVNEAFTELFGYSSDEVLGKNCRLLQKDDRDQTGLIMIRNAILEEKDVTVIVRNYTKSGELIYNEVTISPIFDKKTKKLKYFLGVQKNVTDIQRLIQQIKNLV